MYLKGKGGKEGRKGREGKERKGKEMEGKERNKRKETKGKKQKKVTILTYPISQRLQHKYGGYILAKLANLGEGGTPASRGR